MFLQKKNTDFNFEKKIESMCCGDTSERKQKMNKIYDAGVYEYVCVDMIHMRSLTVVWYNIILSKAHTVCV